MPERARILLVEDDRPLAELMRDFLQHSGEFEVSIEGRGDRAVERIPAEQPDLVVLDIMLPGLDGLQVCQAVRSQYPGPILMLTALGDDVDEIVGLEMGADDYLPKPASPRLLLAHIKSLLRRVGKTVPDADEGRAVRFGELVVHPGRRQATMGDKPVELTTAEFDLLWLLAKNSGTVLSRETIYSELRGIEWDGLDRSVDLRVARLRKKLGDDSRKPRFIKSVRGSGYMLVAP